MKSQNLAANDHNMTTSTRPDEPAETDKNGPSFAEIRQRALEIHLERGGDDSDLENYLGDWLQAERELREKYNKGLAINTKDEAEGGTNASPTEK